jgi:hypothetical protein
MARTPPNYPVNAKQTKREKERLKFEELEKRIKERRKKSEKRVKEYERKDTILQKSIRILEHPMPGTKTIYPKIKNATGGTYTTRTNKKGKNIKVNPDKWKRKSKQRKF